MCYQITYSFPNFNGCTVEVWDCINNLIPRLTGHVITYPYLDYSESMSVKGPQDCFPDTDCTKNFVIDSTYMSIHIHGYGCDVTKITFIAFC